MSAAILHVRDLKTWFGPAEQPYRAVDGVSFSIYPGETFALLGESGCGKSMTALSLLGLNPQPASRIISGEVLLENNNLLAMSEAEMEQVRGRRIAMIFQEPQSSLNPVLTVGQQIAEVLEWHFDLTKQAIERRIIDLLTAVGLPDPQQRSKAYPHQLSGGMKQRVMIAIALAGEPDLLIADEPTTALDVTIQAQILDLLRDIQQRTGMAILLITHDLGVVAQMADRVAVMYAGELVEMASRAQLFAQPSHPYTKKLFAALPSEKKRGHKLTVIQGTVPPLNQPFTACRFVERCEFAEAVCQQQKPVWPEQNQHAVRCHLYQQLLVTAPNVLSKAKVSELKPADKTLLQVAQLQVYFPIKKGVLQRTVGQVKAVDNVSMTLRPAETLALVGESGCGKTTVGKGILQLTKITAGQVRFQDRVLNQLSGRALRHARSDMQIIFQDPFASMNPRMTVRQIIEEGMLQANYPSPQQRAQRVDELLLRVGLRAESKDRYPHEFSGGQRQRICIARALASDPKLIICDEPTSALDVSVQAQILNLLRDIQVEFGISYLFITHNIAVVDYLAHRVAVMYLGRIVEEGTRQEVLGSPKHPYTQALLAAVPKLEKMASAAVKLQGELPSPANPPSGCHFHKRCPQAMEVCTQRYPQSSSLTATHHVTCFLYEEGYHG